jgi:hypothetical protein
MIKIIVRIMRQMKIIEKSKEKVAFNAFSFSYKS